MARPALLVVDPDSSRRRELARGLSGFGYEVVPAVDAAEGRRFAAAEGRRFAAAEGRRFAAGLGPAVLVAARVTIARTAAIATGVRGDKAFCRLARREAGPFHVLPAGPGAPTAEELPLIAPLGE